MNVKINISMLMEIPNALKFVKLKTPEICKLAVYNFPSSIEHIDNITYDMCKYILEDDPNDTLIIDCKRIDMKDIKKNKLKILNEILKIKNLNSDINDLCLEHIKKLKFYSPKKDTFEDFINKLYEASNECQREQYTDNWVNISNQCGQNYEDTIKLDENVGYELNKTLHNIESKTNIIEDIDKNVFAA